MLLLSRKKKSQSWDKFFISLYRSLLFYIAQQHNIIEVQRDSKRSLRLWRVSKKMVNDFNGFQIKTSSDERADRSETKWNMKDFFFILSELMLMVMFVECNSNIKATNDEARKIVKYKKNQIIMIEKEKLKLISTLKRKNTRAVGSFASYQFLIIFHLFKIYQKKYEK